MFSRVSYLLSVCIYIWHGLFGLVASVHSIFVRARPAQLPSCVYQFVLMNFLFLKKKNTITDISICFLLNQMHGDKQTKIWSDAFLLSFVFFPWNSLCLLHARILTRNEVFLSKFFRRDMCLTTRNFLDFWWGEISPTHRGPCPLWPIFPRAH